MNYIKRLESELRESQTALTGLKCGLTDLKSYLQSNKFWTDTTVQVDDVLRRLQDAYHLSDTLAAEQKEINAKL